MIRSLLSITLFFLAFGLYAQEKNTGIPHFDGVPNTPPNLTYGSEVGYDIETGTIIVWNRDSAAWFPLVTDISFDTTGLRNNVYEIATLADTSSIVAPVEGDFFVKDSTTFGVYSNKWNILQSSPGGGGGPVSWNDLTNVPADIADGDQVGLESVATGLTLQGDGQPGSPLEVETGIIATRAYAQSEADNALSEALAADSTSRMLNDSVVGYFAAGVLYDQDTIRTPGSGGTPGPAGRDGEQWYTTTGPPSLSLGEVGDFHLNSTNGEYSEKIAESTWTVRGNLTGPQGPVGPQGPAGDDGANNYPTSLTVTGTSTKTITLQRNGLTDLTETWTDLDVYLTSLGYDSTTNILSIGLSNGASLEVNMEDADWQAGSGGGSLDEEAVQDIVGAMVAGNTETNIAVTYDDATGKLNFVVDLSAYQTIAGTTGWDKDVADEWTATGANIYRNSLVMIGSNLAPTYPLTVEGAVYVDASGSGPISTTLTDYSNPSFNHADYAVNIEMGEEGESAGIHWANGQSDRRSSASIISRRVGTNYLNELLFYNKNSTGAFNYPELAFMIDQSNNVLFGGLTPYTIPLGQPPRSLTTKGVMLASPDNDAVIEFLNDRAAWDIKNDRNGTGTVSANDGALAFREFSTGWDVLSFDYVDQVMNLLALRESPNYNSAQGYNFVFAEGGRAQAGTMRPQQLADLLGPLMDSSDGNGLYSGSGNIAPTTFTTTVQPDGFANSYWQFGFNATSPIRTDDNFPYLGFGWQSGATYGMIGYAMDGEYQIPSLISNTNSYSSLLNANVMRYTQSAGLSAEIQNFGSSLRYRYNNGGGIEEYTLPREQPELDKPGSWVFDDRGDFVGFGGDVEYRVVKQLDQSKSSAGTTNDAELVISGILPGVYEIIPYIEYETTSAAGGLYWQIFCVGEETVGSGYRRDGSRTKVAIENTNFDAATGTTDPQVLDIENAQVRFSGTGQIRFSWGANGTGSTTVKAYSSIILRRKREE